MEAFCTYWGCELTPIQCILTAKHEAFNAPVGNALNNEEELARWNIFSGCFFLLNVTPFGFTKS